jgi:hypothetical protein
MFEGCMFEPRRRPFYDDTYQYLMGLGVADV